MNPKVLATISYLKTCSTNDLKKVLSHTPSNWSISFSKTSNEYQQICAAYLSNCSTSNVRPIYHPTAIKLVNLL